MAADDGSGDWRSRRDFRSEEAGFDAHVRAVLNAAAIVANWSCMAADGDRMRYDGRIATGWVGVSDPSRRLVASLRRLGRSSGGGRELVLKGGWPVVGHPRSMQRSFGSLVRVLEAKLGTHGSFFAAISRCSD